MKMSDSESLLFLKKNEIRINRFVKKIYIFTNLIPLAILAITKMGVYHVPMSIAVSGLVLNLVFTVIFSPVLNIDRFSSSFFKYALATAMQLIIFIYSQDVNIQISILYLCVPVFCQLYFNPQLTIYACIIAYFSMMAGTILSAEQAVELMWHGITPIQHIISTGSSRSLEAIFTSVVLTCSSILARKMMFRIVQKEKEISDFQSNIVYSFADIIESRDGTTGEHVKRTSQVVKLITEKIMSDHNLIKESITNHELKFYPLTAPLHDIGKLKISDHILSKPGKLTNDEFEIIKNHSAMGAEIIDKTIKNIEKPEFVKIAREMALYHHEKWDGTGYPAKLIGNAIPFSARVMAVADVFDALCSDRSYKKAMPVSEALKIMEESKNHHFEAELVDILQLLKDELLQIYRE